MLLDLRIDDLAVMGIQLGEGALIVGADQAAIAGDIGHQNGHQPSLDLLALHWFSAQGWGGIVGWPALEDYKDKQGFLTLPGGKKPAGIDAGGPLLTMLTHCRQAAGFGQGRVARAHVTVTASAKTRQSKKIQVLRHGILPIVPNAGGNSRGDSFAWLARWVIATANASPRHNHGLGGNRQVTGR